MTTATLITRLLELPGEIEHAERVHVSLVVAADESEAALKNREAEYLKFRTIEGKNAEERAATLRVALQAWHDDALHCASKEKDARVSLHRAQNEFAALRSIAKLLSRETE